MKTLSEQLRQMKAQRRLGIMTHVVVGYPSLKETKTTIRAMVNAGVDLIELQVPFSDPVADGPVIMQANDLALQQGMTLAKYFEFVRKLQTEVDACFLTMGYYNTVFHYGVERFCREAQAAGIQGLIIPDIPLDEEAHEQFMANCEHYNLAHIRVMSPNSPEARLRANAQRQNGFVYCTAYAGTTGSKLQQRQALSAYLRRVRQHFTIPIALGFGIGRPEDVRFLRGKVEIAVIGSAVLEHINAHGVESVQPFVRSLVEAAQNDTEFQKEISDNTRNRES